MGAKTLDLPQGQKQGTPGASGPSSILPKGAPGGWAAWARAERVLLFGAAATALYVLGFWLGLKGFNGNLEWQWKYKAPGTLPPFLARSLLALAPGAAIAMAAWLGVRRLRSPRLARLKRWLGLAILLAWGMYYHAAGWTTLHGPDPSILAGTMLEPYMTGWMTVARSSEHGLMPPPAALLRDYQFYLPTFSLHVKTHPMGNFLLCDGALRLTRACPALTRAFLAVMGAMGTDFKTRWLAPLPPSEQAAALGMGVFVVAMGVLAAVPLFFLVRHCERTARAGRANATANANGDRAAWIAAILWLHMPAFVIFTPDFDQVYPLFAMTALLAWMKGMDRRPAAWGALAGLAGALATAMTFKALLWIPLCAPLACLEAARRAGTWRPGGVLTWARSHGADLRRAAVTALAAVGVYIGFFVALKAATGADMIAIFRSASKNQVVLTARLNRTYWTWLFYGPLDVFPMAGPALSLAALAMWSRQVKQASLSVANLSPAALIFPLGIALATLSGLVLGENSRQLLMMNPGLAWAAALWLTRPEAPRWRLNVALMLACQHVFVGAAVKTMEFLTR